MPNEPVVTTSERLWSEEVALAEADDPAPVREVAYRMNNGRVFYQPEVNPFSE